MPISINHNTRVITIPQSFLTPIDPPNLYELDVNDFWVALKDYEDNAEGMALPDTHKRKEATTLAGVTYAPSLEIINGFTVTFEDVGPHYTVRCVGANHNIADVLNFNAVNLIIGNAAGLIVHTVVSGSGVTEQDKADIAALVWEQVLEQGLSAEQITRIMLAALAGKRAGIGTSTETYYGQDGTTPRITLTPDENGNGVPTVNGN